MKKKVLIFLIPVILLISLLFVIRFFYITPYYFGSVLSINLKHGVDNMLRVVFNVKNTVFSTNQPVSWYPKHITLEEKNGERYTYSMYGYLSSVRMGSKNVDINLDNTFGSFPFTLQLRLMPWDEVNGEKRLDLLELNNNLFELSYGTYEKGAALDQAVSFLTGDSKLQDALCTGELVKVSWTDTKSLDELLNTKGVPAPKTFSGDNAINDVKVTIYKGTFSTQEKSKRQMIEQCKT